ncbi:hypothetical protein HGRIS_004239 [Hohenbuehelia grisea]|uniref:Uncharacterized protein n=1 Tax=Hohenbuehelia grisea TaxID=104357 RepID=A0ABR3IP70_9AGAR
MKHSDERVALQAVEFWSTVCEEEIELEIEAQEEYGEMPETESRQFAKVALGETMPVLLNLLTKQEEDADEDEWNVSMAAGTCGWCRPRCNRPCCYPLHRGQHQG